MSHGHVEEPPHYVPPSIGRLFRTYGWKDTRVWVAAVCWLLLSLVAVFAGRFAASFLLPGLLAGTLPPLAYLLLVTGIAFFAGLILLSLGYEWAAAPSYLFSVSFALTIQVDIFSAIIISLAAPVGLSLFPLFDRHSSADLELRKPAHLLRWIGSCVCASLVLATMPVLIGFSIPLHYDVTHLTSIHLVGNLIGFTFLLGLATRFLIPRLKGTWGRFRSTPAPAKGRFDTTLLGISVLASLIILAIFAMDLLLRPTFLLSQSTADQLRWQTQISLITLGVIIIAAVSSVLTFYTRYSQALSEEVARRRSELSALTAISATVSQGEGLDQVLEATLKDTIRFMKADAGVIHLSLAGESLRLSALYNLSKELALTCHILAPSHPILTVLLEERKEGPAPIPDKATARSLLPFLDSYPSFLLLPIRSQGRLRGLITLLREQDDRFTPADQQFGESIALQIGIALDNTRLLLATRTHMRELAGMLEMSPSLSGDGCGVDHSLSEILEQSMAVIGAPKGMVVEFSSGPADMLLRAAMGYGQDSVEFRTSLLRQHVPLLERVRSENRLIIEHSPTTITAIPFGLRNDLVGAMLLEGLLTNGDQTRLVTTLTDLAAMAILQERSFESERRKRALADCLIRTARLMNETFTLEELLSTILDQIEQVVKYDTCAILLRQEGQRERYNLAMHRGRPPCFDIASFEEVRSRFPAMAELLSERKPMLITDVRQDERWPAELGDQHIGSWLGIPLTSKRDLLGVLCVVSEIPGFYSQLDLELTEAFSEQAAIAIDKALIDRRLLRRFDEVTVLNEITRAITSMVDHEEILRFIMDQAQGLFDAEAASIALVDDDGDSLTFVMALGPGADLIGGQRIKIGQGIAGWVAQTGKATYMADSSQDPRFYAGIDQRTGNETRNLICAPMVIEERVIGIVEILNRRSGNFSEEDLVLLAAISAQVGAAVERSRLYADTRKRAIQLAALLETAQAITSTLDLNAVLETIAERAKSLLKTDGCLVFLLDPERQVLKPVVSLGPHSEEALAQVLPVGKGLSGWTARAGIGRILNHAHLDPLAEHIPGTPFDPECLISVPLLAGNETIGVMTVNREGDKTFVEEDLHFLSSLAAQASVAIINSRLYQTAKMTAEQLAALQEIAQAVNSTLDLGSIIEIIDHQIGQIVPHKLLSLALFDEQNERFYRPASRRHPHQPAIPPQEYSLMRQSLRAGRPVVSELESWHLAADELGLRPCSAVAVPILAAEKGLGAFILVKCGLRAFSPEQVTILGELANHLAIAINNARLYQERDQAYKELADAQQQLVQTEKLRALGQMASGVAHNFNNILAVVLGRAQLAQRRAGSEALHKDLDAIAQAARDGATTVRRLQEFTRLQPAEMDQSLIDLNEVVEDVAEITRPRWKDQMQAEGRNFRLVTLTSAIPKVAGNAAELREVLTNMIFNALDALPEGGIITLRTGVIENSVFISVQDTGIGMTEETRGRIFDPFFTTKGPQNSGLGLSTSFGIISRHGGEIHVESEPGAGTTFTIYLPPAGEMTFREEPIPTALTSKRTGRVLVVDDEPELGAVIQRALEEAGHTAEMYTSAKEALRAFHARPFDLVITDLGMPGLSGWDLAAALRETDKEIPIVMITGWGDGVDDKMLEEHRIQSVITKPFDILEVVDATSLALG